VPRLSRLHIEQGPVLERANEPLGVVTAIAGQARGVRVFEGRADHAGTTRWTHERYALVERRVHLHCVMRTRGTVATVARSMCSDASNVVPQKVTVRSTLDLPTPSCSTR